MSHITQSNTQMNVHLGKIIMMVANKYNSLPLTFVESIQNAIDADAKNVFIGINRRNNSAIILDDGLGATADEFNKAIATIAETRKTKDKIGRFGLGVISPLNKCTRFEFISRAVASSDRHPNMWTFVQKNIESQDRDVEIPRQRLDTMPAISKIFAEYAERMGATWNTMVRLFGVTQDRVAGHVDLDELEDLVRTKLGSHLRQRGIHCHVVLIGRDEQTMEREIRPLVYTGDPFPIYTIHTEDAGRVEIELYRAARRGGKRNGNVIVTEIDDPYGISWREIRTQAMGMRWVSTSQFFEVLGSGYFEGVIRCEKLKLDSERTKFERDDGLLGFYIALDDWFNSTGRAYYEAEQEQTRDDRYNRLSLQVMDEVRDYLRLPEFTTLAGQLLSTVHFGRIGGGHGLENKKVVGQDEQSSTRTGAGGAGVERTPSDTPRTGGRGDGKTRDGDIPTGVIGRGKKPRALVKDDSVGLWIEVTDLEFSTRLWEFEAGTGRLQFNSRNAVWLELDGLNIKRRTAKHDRQIMHLQKWVILQVLQLLRFPLEEFEERRRFIDEQTRPYMVMFIAS